VTFLDTVILVGALLEKHPEHSSENSDKRQGARDKGRRAGAESRSGVPPLSERSAVRPAREARRRRSNIHPPFSSLVVFEEHGDSPSNPFWRWNPWN